MASHLHTYCSDLYHPTMKRAALITTLATALGLFSSSAFAAEKTLYFYSPEFGPGNLSVLTEAADAFFSDSGVEVGFQPFARLEDFRREIEARPPTFIIAPEWVTTHECIAPRLTAIVQPVAGGETSGRRALMADHSIDSAKQIANGSVAAAVADFGTDREDVSMGRFRADHPSVNVIPVPKDIDALLAVGFGQVDAAFVSLAQFQMLERINPNLTAKLHEIGYSQESQFPRLYSTARANDADIAEIAETFAKIREIGAGRRMFSILGFDDARVLTGKDRSIINAPKSCSFAEGTQ
jgi:ABC-type amino acid transport substrate-binding protein